jgi:hypothetical protein
LKAIQLVQVCDIVVPRREFRLVPTCQTDEESSDGRSVLDPELSLNTAVARFHARKFGTKASGSGERRAALKVHFTGNIKKQKTPIKASAKEVFAALHTEGLDLKPVVTKRVVEEEIEGMTHADVAPQQSIPEHLMGTRDEARQEQ